MGMKRLFLACILVFSQTAAFSTALDDYTALPDVSFTFSQYGSSFYDGSPLFGGTATRAYVLDLTSQSWRDVSEVSPTVWKHWVTVIVPEQDWAWGTTNDTALLLINGGNITDPAPVIDPGAAGYSYAELRLLAFATRSVVIELQGVPNQPLAFTDEAFTRVEDEIIAYSWDKYLQGGDDYWPVQLPMVKSVVRCMDAVEAFVFAETGKVINDFVLTGGSKRGWTAWLTAAVDMRVSAIAPIVSDLLNMPRSFAHHWSSYGFWADALSPYEDMGIFEWFDDPAAQTLMDIVDPYAYRDRLDLPKFIVTAAGDDFFVHDSIQFYLDGLPGETYVRTMPNTNHYLEGAYDEVFANMVPYYDAFLQNQARPEFTWTLNADGSITVDTTGQAPIGVYLWQADNPASRDFRQITIGNTWTSSAMTEQSPGIYLADVGIPSFGWRSFFVELVYDHPNASLGLDSYDYHFTTEMRVLPEERPFEADLTRDRFTNMADFSIFSQNWLLDTSYYDIFPRRNGDGIIDLAEISILSLHWLEEN